MESFVLQTRPLFESHTGANIAEVLQAVVTDWGLKRPNHGIAIATQDGLGVPHVTRLPRQVRHVAAYFHQSSAATTLLMSKQEQL